MNSTWWLTQGILHTVHGTHLCAGQVVTFTITILDQFEISDLCIFLILYLHNYNIFQSAPLLMTRILMEI